MPATSAFELAGATVRVDVTTSAATVDMGVEAPQLLISNTDDTDAICIRFFKSQALADASPAVMPTVGTPQIGIIIPARTTKVVSVNGCRFASVIGAGAAVIYLTPGEGL